VGDVLCQTDIRLDRHGVSTANSLSEGHPPQSWADKAATNTDCITVPSPMAHLGFAYGPKERPAALG